MSRQFRRHPLNHFYCPLEESKERILEPKAPKPNIYPKRKRRPIAKKRNNG